MKELIDGKEYLVENEIYTPVVKETPFEEMGGTYKIEMIAEDLPILVPNLEEEVEEDWSNIRRWGRERQKYLEVEKPQVYQRMVTQNELYLHLMEIQGEAEEFWEMEISKMKKSFGLTEEMKSKDFLGYVGLLNNIHSSLKEIILKEIIYR